MSERDWTSFSDLDLQLLVGCLSEAPSGGSLRANGMIDEIIIELSRRAKKPHIEQFKPGAPVEDGDGDRSFVTSVRDGRVYTNPFGSPEDKWSYRPHELTVIEEES